MVSSGWLIGDDRRDTADENTITGLEDDHSERWAAWATDIDMRVDIERIMAKLAQKYMPSLKHTVVSFTPVNGPSAFDVEPI